MLTRLIATLSVAGITAVLAQVPVNQDIYNKIVRYTAFASAAYAEDCPSPPYGSQILQFFNDTVTDTQATLFRDSNAQELVLSFRGTSTPVDLDTDVLFNPVNLNIPGASCSGCQVHNGFQIAYNAIGSRVASTVNNAVATNPGFNLIVTGHSLGAGLASLASAALSGLGNSVTTYTYGEPRNGNSAFASYINAAVPNYYRVTHANDGVPQIPPQVLGFSHHGTEYWQRLASGNSAGTTLVCTGNEPTGCNAGQVYGQNPINGAHIAYSNGLVANPLNNAACGFN